MREYIEREAVVAEFHRLGLGENSLVEKIFADGVYSVLGTFPAADVEPVRHGRWEDRDDSGAAVCSYCGGIHKAFNQSTFHLSRYCPNCGAKMDL